MLHRVHSGPLDASAVSENTMTNWTLGFAVHFPPRCLETSTDHDLICLEPYCHLVAAAGHLIRNLGATRLQQLSIVRVQNCGIEINR